MSYQEKAAECLKEGEFQKAVNFYSLAINNTQKPASILYTSRAKASFSGYLNDSTEPESLEQRQWKKITADCDTALDLDRGNLDAKYLNALQKVYGAKNPKVGLDWLLEVYKQSLVYNGRYKKVYVLPRDIYSSILKVKQSIARERAQDSLVNSNRLFTRLVQHLEDDYHGQLDQYNLKKLDKKTFEYATTNLAVQYNKDIRDIVSIFKNNYNHALTSLDEHHEAPSHLCDPISFTLFMDPVITPSGQSYERSWLWSHLEKSQTDPLTREQLSQDQCYTNLSLKECVDEYLEEIKGVTV